MGKIEAEAIVNQEDEENSDEELLHEILEEEVSEFILEDDDNVEGISQNEKTVKKIL